MSGQNQHHEIEKCTNQVKQAYQMIVQAKTNGDMDQLMQAQQQLLQAEEHLKATQERFGNEALNNPQFQQTEEQLHDARQEIELFRNNHR
ncbi:hypothetical protein AQ616_02010 [Oceanobacillus sp. E9]|uniref:DUF2564 family protein n=1 Tax=Oceanobacillus kimchii TaxID=746691 RepID=A0ABQ5TPE1_9BACI|nr:MULTISPECIES: hypothetical protein [Oceanobacillus]MBT2599772.1 hypothetical protein [Oceanobacillus sp. ISL-74]OEH56317.1 hypothetical protein AQ616_02010 [Oceanobacillus sp. E9]GLO68002.1 hypothetical protein MACH08_37860 [Oceanobacillus kimchii]